MAKALAKVSIAGDIAILTADGWQHAMPEIETELNYRAGFNDPTMPAHADPVLWAVAIVEDELGAEVIEKPKGEWKKDAVY